MLSNQGTVTKEKCASLDHFGHCWFDVYIYVAGWQPETQTERSPSYHWQPHTAITIYDSLTAPHIYHRNISSIHIQYTQFLSLSWFDWFLPFLNIPTGQKNTQKWRHKNYIFSCNPWSQDDTATMEHWFSFVRIHCSYLGFTFYVARNHTLRLITQWMGAGRHSPAQHPHINGTLTDIKTSSRNSILSFVSSISI